MKINRIRWVQFAAMLMAGFLCTIHGTWAGEKQSTVETLVKLFSQWSDANSKNQTILTEAALYIDYKSMAKTSLGAQWNKLSEVQRKEFVESFRKLVERRYYPRWHKIFSKSHVSYGKESVQDGVIRVQTQITIKDSVQEVDWELKGQGADAKVVNLTVGDKDLVARAGRRFQKRLAKTSFPAFIAWIKAQTAKSAGTPDK